MSHNRVFHLYRGPGAHQELFIQWRIVVLGLPYTPYMSFFFHYRNLYCHSLLYRMAHVAGLLVMLREPAAEAFLALGPTQSCQPSL